MSESPKRDAGYTLVEMLVTIIMFTLIVGAITTVVITSLKHQTSLSDRSTALANARTALERVDRDIRDASPLCYATGTEIAMYVTPDSTASYIDDYSVNTATRSLVFTRYNVSTSASGNVACQISTLLPGNTVPTVATWYESGLPVETETLLTNLTGSYNSMFTQPSAANFSTCPTGTTPSLTTAGAAAAVPELTTTVSVQPPTLHSPVTTSDCGTFIRNYDTPS